MRDKKRLAQKTCEAFLLNDLLVVAEETAGAGKSAGQTKLSVHCTVELESVASVRATKDDITQSVKVRRVCVSLRSLIAAAAQDLEPAQVEMASSGERAGVVVSRLARSSLLASRLVPRQQEGQEGALLPQLCGREGGLGQRAAVGAAADEDGRAAQEGHQKMKGRCERGGWTDRPSCQWAPLVRRRRRTACSSRAPPGCWAVLSSRLVAADAVGRGIARRGGRWCRWAAAAIFCHVRTQPVLSAAQAFEGWDVVAMGGRRGDVKCNLLDFEGVSKLVVALHPQVRAWPNEPLSCELQVLVHCAAERRTERVQADPQQSRKLNVDATQLLAKLCKENHCWLLFISTDYVFDGARSFPRQARMTLAAQARSHLTPALPGQTRSTSTGARSATQVRKKKKKGGGLRFSPVMQKSWRRGTQTGAAVCCACHCCTAPWRRW